MHALHLANPQAIAHAQRLLADPSVRGWYMKLQADPQRTLAQNALLWPLLTELERQLTWPLWTERGWVAGRLVRHEWKDFLTASFKRETATVAQGMDGRGYVLVGASTRDMSKAAFSEFLEFVLAFGAQQGVRFDQTDPGAPLRLPPDY